MSAATKKTVGPLNDSRLWATMVFSGGAYCWLRTDTGLRFLGKKTREAARKFCDDRCFIFEETEGAPT